MRHRLFALSLTAGILLTTGPAAEAQFVKLPVGNTREATAIGRGLAGRGPSSKPRPGGGATTGGGGAPTTSGPGQTAPTGATAPAAAPAPASAGPGPLSGPSTSTGAPAPVVAAGTGGASVATDWTQWSVWWEMNKDRYLRLKEAIHRADPMSSDGDFFLGEGDDGTGQLDYRPSTEEIQGKVAPALLASLEAQNNPEFIANVLIALAKLGLEADAPPEHARAVEETLVRYVRHPNTFVSGWAVAALGILGSDKPVFLLADLLEDNEKAHIITESSRVSERVRSFSAYSLGLIGKRTERADVRTFIAHKLFQTLESWDGGPRDLPVACISALGIVALEPSTDGHDATDDQFKTHCRQSQILGLLEYFKDNKVQYLVRAHVPTALARLTKGLGDDELRTQVAEALLKPLGVRAKARREVEQSCALALGLIGDADLDKIDRRIRDTLRDSATRIGDQTVRHFSLVALSQIATNPGRGDGEPLEATPELAKFLMGQIARGKTATRPWIAMSLGVLGRGLLDVRRIPPTEPSETLREALADASSHDEIGSYCVGSGLHGDLQNAEVVSEQFADRGDDIIRGYAALGLGLMDSRAHGDVLMKLLPGASNRPTLLSQTATAMALIGEKRVVPELINLLERAGSTAERNSISLALSACGDSRSIDPLLELFQDEQSTDLARAFAAIALGNVGEKDRLPWRTSYASNVNYLAATVTLTGGEGILDIP